VQGIRILLN